MSASEPADRPARDGGLAGCAGDPEAAARLGGRAADDGVPLRELVDGVLRDGGVGPRLRAAVSAAIDGHSRRARAELDRHGADRAAFVSDLLTGRAEPGGLAERAQRYGI